ncbi:MAG: hypothetical protein ACPGJE_03975, partial [Wenzhouxiangellaceae bacterium]
SPPACACPRASTRASRQSTKFDFTRNRNPEFLRPLLRLAALIAVIVACSTAVADDFCGADCVLSEDFDSAVSGNASGPGTLPTGWLNVAGENVGDGCFGEPCADWWVNDSTGNETAGDPVPQILFDASDGIGNYLYVASEGNDNDTVSLLTPTFDLDAANTPYATFSLFSFDTGSPEPNTLWIDIMDAAGTTVVSPSVFTVGDVGINKWRRAFVDLDGTASGTYRLRLRWASTIDQDDFAGTHDIAIDDFAVVADRQAVGGEGAAVMQTHILPAPENDILQFLNETQASAANPIETYTGISIALDNVIIYFDEQEDGYETDVANPTQTDFVVSSAAPAPLNRSTQVWGDGYPENGYPPGHPEDILSLGEVIILREPQIDVGTLTTVLDKDAGDMIASSDEIAITRVFWASGDETLNAGSVELFPTDRWGSDYRIPFGENITAAVMDATVSCGDNDIFEEVALFIMADTDGTSVSVDFNNGGGATDFSTTLDRGESAFVGFDAGADGRHQRRSPGHRHRRECSGACIHRRRGQQFRVEVLHPVAVRSTVRHVSGAVRGFFRRRCRTGHLQPQRRRRDHGCIHRG